MCLQWKRRLQQVAREVVQLEQRVQQAVAQPQVEPLGQRVVQPQVVQPPQQQAQLLLSVQFLLRLLSQVWLWLLPLLQLQQQQQLTIKLGGITDVVPSNMNNKSSQIFASFIFKGNEMAWMRGAVITLLALAWMAPTWAAGGWVYDASGDVSVAVGKEPAHRAIKNDTIASDTVISTGDKAYAVLKFEDGQVVTMQANSTFHVREYSYQPDKIEKSNMLFSMLKGGMRFVTGLIGQRNKTAFKLSTPNMTIGIRGTEFMVAMVNNSMYSQVVSGSIGLTNAAGTVALGAGQAAVVASATTLATVIPISALPAGTFSQLGAIPVPPATPAPAPAPAGGASTGGASTGGASTGGATGSTAGGAATGGATTATTAATAGAATGVSATTIAVGAGVAATAAAIANTSTTTHH